MARGGEGGGGKLIIGCYASYFSQARNDRRNDRMAGFKYYKKIPRLWASALHDLVD